MYVDLCLGRIDIVVLVEDPAGSADFGDSVHIVCTHWGDTVSFADWPDTVGTKSLVTGSFVAIVIGFVVNSPVDAARFVHDFADFL